MYVGNEPLGCQTPAPSTNTICGYISGFSTLTRSNNLTKCPTSLNARKNGIYGSVISTISYVLYARVKSGKFRIASIAQALFVFLMKLISTPAMYFSPVKGECGEKVRWEVVSRTLLDKASCSLMSAGRRRWGGYVSHSGGTVGRM